jgi:hypothetical protein
MHITPEFTPAAMARWLRIPNEAKEALLAEVWCGRCKTGVLIREVRGELRRSGDIILRGSCAFCDGEVCRVIETGETMGQPDVFP